MARTTRKAHAAILAFDALTIEGALIAPALLARIAEQKAGGQAESDYNVPKGLTLRDEIARYFRIGQALFRELFASTTPPAAATTRFVETLLRDVFGFADICRVGMRMFGERLYPVTLETRAGRVPVVVVPPSDELDAPSAHLPSEGRRRSAASAVQDWLNASDDALWGLCSNGAQLRLLRANASLTRPAFIQADLRRIFEGEAFADFAALWLLIHASRFGMPGLAPTDCPLEHWREAGAKEGITARERLREGVEAALLSLGGGFLGHPDNTVLRERLASGALPLPEYFGQLLRLVYRLIFLLAAEDRSLLHPPSAPAVARRLYAEGYSVGALRDRAVRRAAWDRHHDRWEGLLIVFAGLASGERRLGLPALGGLFEPGTIPDLGGARLANRDLMGAIYRLAWLREESGIVPVNWRDMETEELGSVYESLLELTPRLTADGRGFAFADGGEGKGHARKTTGSYYTPDSLVQALLDSALDPVLDRIEAEAEDPEALLSVTVVDPACGSGHFLLAAARRIATRVACRRAGGVASAEDYRHALREVVSACIHGVDRNPLAVELTRVALWIETVEPGKPLGFLDANIRCGDALLGVFDLKTLAEGIPDAAYKPLTGDDKATARYYAARNRDERGGQGNFDFARGGGRLPEAAPLAAAARALHALPEDSLADIAEKRRRFAASRADPRLWTWQVACDLYIAAFLVPKTGGEPVNRNTVTVPTTGHLWQTLADGQLYGPLVAAAQDLAGTARAFHWPLEFPDVMAAGGFDVVLGNPPWDTLSPDAKEFFSVYDPAVRFMAKPEQEARFAELRQHPGVDERWTAYCRHIYAMAAFIRQSGRYNLFAEGNLGKGDFNIYRMFVELALSGINHSGRAAQFVPENLYNGANATAIRKHLYHRMSLRALIAFENTGKIWFDIDLRAKFCLYMAGGGGPTTTFRCAFGVNSKEKLAAAAVSLPIDMPVSLIEEFSPEALAIAEVAHPFDISVSKKIYARFPKFGAEIAGAPEQVYMAEVHMGNDRGLFVEDPKAIPVYEGRMVEAFDHRAKKYVSGRGRAADWDELVFGAPDKKISPQWYILFDDLPRKLEGRWQRYRIGFCDVGGVTNARFLMASLIPRQVVCGHSVPTIEFGRSCNTLMVYWLGIANSFCADFVARKKGANHMTYTVLDSLPLPRQFTGSAIEIEIAQRALRLAATGPEMRDFWNSTAPDLGLDPLRDTPSENAHERQTLRTELDVLVARDVFGLMLDEMRYVLDPSDILGDDCDFETFGALKRAERRASSGAFTRAI